MPFPMKIQPIEAQVYQESIRNDSTKPVLKSRLKRLFDRQFQSVLRISSGADKPSAAGEAAFGKDGVAEFEPSSVCLDKMVQNFIEDSNEKPSLAVKCGRNRCNCFNGNIKDSSDDEFDVAIGFSDSNTNGSFGDSADTLKSLIPCASVAERNLLADTSRIVEKNRLCKLKEDLIILVTDGLLSLGYDASVCKSRWEKTSSYPAGEYEYIDVIVKGERLLIDVDFRSEFEIARSTGNYKAILHCLPYIFVGKGDRLQQIVSILSEAAKQSLKKKGMHIPPWRKAEYMKSKWLSTHTRTTPPLPSLPAHQNTVQDSDTTEIKRKKKAEKESFFETTETDFGELDLIFGEKESSCQESRDENSSPPSSFRASNDEQNSPAIVSTWGPPATKQRSKVVVTGLASLLKEKS